MRRTTPDVLQALRDLNRTQVELAEHLGKSKQYVSTALMGPYSGKDLKFTPEELVQVAEFCGLPIKWVIQAMKAYGYPRLAGYLQAIHRSIHMR